MIAQNDRLRAAGQQPLWGSTYGLVEYIASEMLWGDALVVNWLIEIGGTTGVHIGSMILRDVVRPMLDAGGTVDAYKIYRRVLGLDDPARWERLAPVLVNHGMLDAAAFEEILAYPALLAEHPATWGATAVDLLARLVHEVQQQEWPSQLRYQQAVAEHLGQSFDADAPFQPRHDDGPDAWYFGAADDSRPHVVVARHVEGALREAARLDEQATFQSLADRLLAAGYAIGGGLILAVLLDCLSGRLSHAAWLHDEAMRILAQPEIQKYQSLSDLRRLTRLALPTPTDTFLAKEILESIRESELANECRIVELADLEAWGGLAQVECEAIAEAREAGRINAPSDPRDKPAMRSSLIPNARPRQQPSWPHPEDHEWVNKFSEPWQREDPSALPADYELKLTARLEALGRIVSRDEARSDRWLGEILGWCHRGVTELRAWCLSQPKNNQDERSLLPLEWKDAMDRFAPWWLKQVELSLQRLRGEIPVGHEDDHSGHLAWGSNDPIYQSLSYLDEVLSIEPDEPFQEYQQDLAEAIDNIWDDWPAFTRATALCVLRPWFWQSCHLLRTRLTTVIEAEMSPLVLNYALENLLQFLWPEMAQLLERLLFRAMPNSELAEIVNRVANQIGYAVVADRGNEAAAPEFLALTDILSAHKSHPVENAQTEENFVNGLLRGSTHCLEESPMLTVRHAEGWLEIVNWGIQRWPSFASGSDNDRFPLHSVFTGLWRPWPDPVRAYVYHELEDGLLHIVRQGTLGDFCMLHYELRNELEGKRRRQSVLQGSGKPALLESGFTDQYLVRFCQESAARVSRWRAEGKRSDDLGWMGGPSGQDTAQLIEKVIEHGRDRDYLRRMLPSIIDTLSEAECTTLAAKLRIGVRNM
ncbi:MAG: hypothetical protein GXX96_38540 [Planctomycetaceae bacterium]|nr:hypothetical protein [Planctomycetaceae bacterium]